MKTETRRQVDDLQSRLSRLQVTMLGVMEKYGPMSRLEHLTVRNMSMGSLLILLPFAPNLRTLSMKYREVASNSNSNADDAAVPNLTDELFAKIFQKNKFEVFEQERPTFPTSSTYYIASLLQHLETLLIWCKTLSTPTARWFVQNCPLLTELRNLSFWDMGDEDGVAVWREGRNRMPDPVDVQF